MLETFEVSKVLIIAPLRVARDTWPAEIEKWDHLKGLDISVIVGDVKTRIAAVHHPAMIYIVNRENIKWLVEYYEKNGMRWDFGMVVIDELSSFKNYQSQRFKFLRKVRPFVKRWVGLTGTPSSNGLMDLWAEIGILDGGERLGKFIGRYREAYFKAGSMNPATGIVFQYQWQHEPCLYGWKQKGKHQWYSDRKQTTIWEYDRPKSNKDHPTMKPIGLMSYPIRNSTMTNGIVLDPFLGSGSTLIACEETDRVCRGIELDPKFVDVIVKRYIEHSDGHYDDVYVIRDGQKLKFEEVATFEPEREVADGE